MDSKKLSAVHIRNGKDSANWEERPWDHGDDSATYATRSRAPSDPPRNQHRAG
jgi:hypothetical protein